uniref:Homeobox transcription factor HD07c n=1 Tax=Mnemiopsis leidyi TaxID=27923 RepID=E3UJT9_MNELE|nr:homeobox transcription factor HD07c [Mnemiopsis leidyi]
MVDVIKSRSKIENLTSSDVVVNMQSLDVSAELVIPSRSTLHFLMDLLNFHQEILFSERFPLIPLSDVPPNIDPFSPNSPVTISGPSLNLPSVGDPDSSSSEPIPSIVINHYPKPLTQFPLSAEKPYLSVSRTKFTPLQLEMLEERFRLSPVIGREEREELAEQIGVPHLVLRNWFQNRRARQRKSEEVQRKIDEAAATANTTRYGQSADLFLRNGFTRAANRSSRIDWMVLINDGAVCVSRPRHPHHKKKDICCGGTHVAYNAMARISHQFAYDIIGAHVQHSGPVDLAISPYSIISVLQALSLGARGQTKFEIDSQLKFSSNRNHEIMKCSLDSFQQESNVTVLVASRLFADEPLMKCLDPVFAKELKYYYDSDVEGVPFSKDPATAWKSVNTFVEEKTNGIVSDFVNRQHIDVPMMTIEGLFRSITISKYKYYGDNLKVHLVISFDFCSEKVAFLTQPKVQVVELPYSDEKYNMYIFMAEKGKLNLSFMESIINQETIPTFKTHYLEDQDRPLKVVLPKFKISSEIDISRALYEKGVKKLFSRDADLEGIFSEFPVHFNKMYHKSVIEVTEEGTTAAGATSYTLIRAYEKQEEFIINRPFVYVIHDACNNMVLFQGRFYGRNLEED